MNVGDYVFVYERQGYSNNLLYGERCRITQSFGNGCFEVYGEQSRVNERVYLDEMYKDKL